jgi:hypothetical protein
MTTHRLHDDLLPRIEKAIEANSMGEEVWWDTTFLPTDEGMQVFITCWVRGAVLGQHLNYYWSCPPIAAWMEGGIENSIETGMKQMFDARSKQIEEMAQGNGDGGLTTG